MPTFTQNLITATILTPLTLSAATELPNHWHNRLPQITITALDRNEDHLISFTEALTHPNLSDRFLAIDKDGDGFIDPKELDSAELFNPHLLQRLMSSMQLNTI